VHRFFILLSLIVVAGCSGSRTAVPAAPTPVANPSPAPAPAGPPTVTITAAGMNPLEITIAVGQTVTFVNNDSRPHDVTGGVDPDHPECPEILVAGFITPGQARQTGVFTTARTCEYHDHSALGVAAFQGRIIIR
jgi:plastocyanin